MQRQALEATDDSYPFLQLCLSAGLWLPELPNIATMFPEMRYMLTYPKTGT